MSGQWPDTDTRARQPSAGLIGASSTKQRPASPLSKDGFLEVVVALRADVVGQVSCAHRRAQSSILAGRELIAAQTIAPVHGDHHRSGLAHRRQFGHRLLCDHNNPRIRRDAGCLPARTAAKPRRDCAAVGCDGIGAHLHFGGGPVLLLKLAADGPAQPGGLAVPLRRYYSSAAFFLDKYLPLIYNYRVSSS